VSYQLSVINIQLSVQGKNFCLEASVCYAKSIINYHISYQPFINFRLKFSEAKLLPDSLKWLARINFWGRP